MLNNQTYSFLSSFLGVAFGYNQNHELSPKMIQLIERQLQCREEIENRKRDALGRWELSCTNKGTSGKEDRPFLDESLDHWRKKIYRSNSDIKPEPLWPEGKSFAICLTHDADHVNLFSMRERWRFFMNQKKIEKPSLQCYARFSKTLIKTSIRGLMKPTDALWNGYSKWLKLEESFGFKSTILFLAELIEPWHPVDSVYSFKDKVYFDNKRMSVGEMIKEIDNAGWDIGVHGSYYSALVPGLLKSQKSQLENLLNKDIVSTRQHYLNYDIMKTPRIHSDAGINVDSTQGFNRSIGFRAGTSYPYYCWDAVHNQELPVLEIPLHIQDGTLFSKNGCGCKTVDSALIQCLQLMDRVEAVSGCLTLIWHPISFLSDVRCKTYEILLEEAKRRNAWGCSMSELSSWWTSRTKKIIDKVSPD